MKKGLLDTLVCPVCKQGLELSVEEENEQEIVSGRLYCPRCAQNYPIIGGIPNLLPPDIVGRCSGKLYTKGGTVNLNREMI